MAEASGRHTLVAASEDDTVTIGIDTVRTETLELGDVETFTLEEPGDILDLRFDIVAGEQYDWSIFEGDGLTSTMLDESGAEVILTDLEDGTRRFVATEDAEYRVRVTGESPEDANEFDIEVYTVAHWTAYYGEDGDEAYFDQLIEPESFDPFVDPACNTLPYCIFIRADITIEYRFESTTAGATWDLNVDADAIDGDPLSVSTDVETKIISLDAADADRTFCYELVPTSDITSGVTVTVASI